MVWDPKKYEALKSTEFADRANLDYKLNTLGMFRAWQVSGEDNVDGANSVTLSLYIDPRTKHIRKTLLHLKLLRWRSYAWRTVPLTLGEIVLASGEGVYQTGTVGRTTSTQTTHTHGGAVAADGSHNHTIEKHTHLTDMNGVELFLEHSIYLGSTAPDAYITINTIDRTAALGGPWTVDQDQLDITAFIQKGWNSIQLRSGGQGRLHASLYAETYLPA